MLIVRRIRSCVLGCCLAGVAYGQRPVPIADPVDKPLLPSGLSHRAVHLNAPLAYIFEDDATSTLHFIGQFQLTVGPPGGQTFTSNEAVLWITNHRTGNPPYRHLDMMLWRDARIHEVGHTATSGPALFVTLNTTGEITTEVDDIAYQASRDNEAYRAGNILRNAIAEGSLAGADEQVIHRVMDVGGLAKEKELFKPRPVIQIRSEGELNLTEAKEGRQVLTITGGVYLSRGVPGSGDQLEIRADSVVVFLPLSSSLGQPEGQAGLGSKRVAGLTPSGPRSGGRSPRTDRDKAGRASDQQLLSTGFGKVEVEGAYLEGDVVMTQGPNMIRASKIYYDFLTDRAVILDAVVRATLVERNIPLYLRASEIRQLSRTHFTATDAVLTTSEFHTPHYHVGAGRIELSGLTPVDPTKRGGGLASGSFDIRRATLNVKGRPVLYWPHVHGNIDTSETAIRSVRTGFSDDFGFEIETKWDLFNILGLVTPKGFDGSLSLDYFSERGPAVEANVNYQRDTYFGKLRSFLLSDDGRDNLGRDRERQSKRDSRGRFLLRHRQFLEDEWQLSLELSYISDRGFLEEFFESEFDNDKEQETLLYLKKQHDNWAFTTLLQSRILDFTTQTERLPDLAYHLIGETFERGTTWFSENRLGIVRFRRTDQPFEPVHQRLRELTREGRITPSSGSVARIDTRQEADAAIDMGPVRFVPFASVRGTAWDDSPGGGGLGRVFGTYGIRGSMYLSRVYPNAQSTLFDIDGVRHIIKPDLVAWVSHTNHDSRELFPFDETVEDIDEVDGFSLGVRQRFQTRRGTGANRRKVDFLTWDVDMGLFSDARRDEITNGFTSFSRPENSISQNYVNSAVIWRANDRTALLSELNYDLNDGEVDLLDISAAVERSPRLSYLLGYRFIEESDSNLLGFDMNYQLTEKHSMALRELFDLSRGRTLDFTVAFVRKFPRWFGAISFALDEAENDFGVSISIWPEGLPQATLGSRRFTGVTNIARLRRR